ncbi:hypothetical protein [Candidatus Entotheonella palauensis]|uniref:Uncharacterized protein n=1 Tax=Candidatus Entotheonella gemina TaxID=1429439 RepID=W4LN15_9BACT|nr:hypothetical protein [Candidatus Entotheonella palauensis]ETW99110.1 MAG: hypothetical protein ETSY2_41570 [Candidatus Entotheonella gemina]
MTQPQTAFGTSSSDPWWARKAFRFAPPCPYYDSLYWRQAVMNHAMMQDLVAFLRCRISGTAPYFMQEYLDEQGHWFPLESMLRALDLEAPPDDLFPLPQPRPVGCEVPNTWLITLDDKALDAPKAGPVFVPLGLAATRLLPVSHRPIAQFVAVWLAYGVLPVCAQNGGPSTWKALDTMLSPIV